MKRSYNFKDVHALVVDDDPNMRTILRMALDACGFGQVTVANGGKEAFHNLGNIRPDLVITDWQMRDGDGIDFIRHVRRSPASPDRYVPIMLLSGFAHPQCVIEARDVGVSDFLVKPISARTILSRLTSVIEQPRPFVEAPNYFGPCRRRTSSDYSERERRVRQPEEAPLEAAAVSTDEDVLDLVDTDRVRMFRPPNRLRAKTSATGGHDPSALLARVEASLVALRQQYPSWAAADLSQLYRAIDAARKFLDERAAHIEEVHEISHKIRSQGGTFGYSLMTQIGNSLCKLVEAAGEFGEKELEAIQVHAQSMQLALSSDLKSDTDSHGKQLLAGLQAVTAKLT